MRHLRKAAQSVEQLRPFLPNRREFFLPLGGQAITPAAAAVAAGFPAAPNPAALLHAVQQWVEGRHGESQRPFGLLLETPKPPLTVKRPVFPKAEDRPS